MTAIDIDLYSDTQSKPTPDMRKAMAEAEVGDEQQGTDPTVTRLCEMTAELLGKKAAVFLPSGTMCNQISVAVHCRAGDEIIADRTAHIVNTEGGGLAVFAGAMSRVVDGNRGIYTGDQLRAAGSARAAPYAKATDGGDRADVEQCRRNHLAIRGSSGCRCRRAGEGPHPAYGWCTVVECGC